MATKLKARNPDDSIQAKKPVMLIFGEAGVGKTWTALDFPNAYYIDSEGGASQRHYIAKLKKSGGMYFGQEDGSQNFEEVIEQVKTLATEKHTYKTLVIDSFSHLQLLEIGKEVEKMMKDKKDMTKTYGAEKKPSAAYAKRLVDWLNRVDMTVIVIAHEKQKYEDSVAKGFTADAWDKMEYLFNLVLRIRKQGETRTALIQKGRLENLGTGGSFPWSYEAFAEKYGKKELEEESKPLELATKEQLKKLETLLESWKAPENFIEKTLDNAKCSSFEEMDKDKLDKVIAFIENKLTIKTEK